MCRFIVYKGPELVLSTLITEPQHSLIRQSYQSQLRHEPLNGDGFGLAWYVPEVSARPGKFRSIQPAWNNSNLRELARVTRSGLVFAHVRAATAGLGVSEHNCHPFTSGTLTFMHNGLIGGFENVKRHLQADLSDAAFHAIQGSTDSEHLFSVLQDAYSHGAHDGDATERLTGSLVATIRTAVETGAEVKLNLAVTDGQSVVVSRFASKEPLDSLFLSHGRQYRCDDGVCRMVPSTAPGSAVLVASEPLSQKSDWQEVPAQHMVVIGESAEVEVRGIEV